MNLMTKNVFVTAKGQELTTEELLQNLMKRVSDLENQVTLNTNVLREVINELQK